MGLTSCATSRRSCTEPELVAKASNRLRHARFSVTEAALGCAETRDTAYAAIAARASPSAEDGLSFIPKYRNGIQNINRTRKNEYSFADRSKHHSASMRTQNMNP